MGKHFKLESCLLSCAVELRPTPFSFRHVDGASWPARLHTASVSLRWMTNWLEEVDGVCEETVGLTDSLAADDKIPHPPAAWHRHPF